MQPPHYIKHCVPSIMGLKYLIPHPLLEMWESLQSTFVKYLLHKYKIFLWKQKQSDKFLDHLMNPEAQFNAKLKRLVCPCVAEPSGLQPLGKGVCSSVLSFEPKYPPHRQWIVWHFKSAAENTKGTEERANLDIQMSLCRLHKFNSESHQKLLCLSEPGYTCKTNRLH